MGRFIGAPADSSYLDQSEPNLAEDPGDEVNDGKHIVDQLLNRVVAPELLREVGTHVGPFCKWQGANTDDLPNQGVRIEKAADWLELCQRLFPVRDEMVAGTLAVVIVGIVVDRTLHTVYACECPQGVRVHLLAALLHSRTLSTRLVVASLGVHHFDSATCDHSRHRQFRGHLHYAHPDSALDQTRSIVAECRELLRNGALFSLTSEVIGTATTIRRSPRAHAPPQLCLLRM